jgi:hypothetical protein
MNVIFHWYSESLECPEIFPEYPDFPDIPDLPGTVRTF